MKDTRRKLQLGAALLAALVVIAIALNVPAPQAGVNPNATPPVAQEETTTSPDESSAAAPAASAASSDEAAAPAQTEADASEETPQAVDEKGQEEATSSNTQTFAASGGDSGVRTTEQAVADITEELSTLDPGEDYAPEKVLVGVAEGTTADTLSAVLAASDIEGMQGASVEMITDDVALITLAKGASVPSCVAELMVSGLVESAEPDYLLYTTDEDEGNGQALASEDAQIATNDSVDGAGASNTSSASETDQTDEAQSAGDASSVGAEETAEETKEEVVGPVQEDALEEAASEEESLDLEVADEASEQANEKSTLLEALGLADLINDPSAKNTYANNWHLQSMNVDDVWKSGVRCGNNVSGTNTIAIAILDEGFQIDHEDLAANIVGPYNAATRTAGTASNMSAGSGHGTHVAGIAGAVANNGKGVAGVSYNANIVPIRLMDDSGSMNLSSLIAAYDYVINNKEAYNIKVINMSVGLKTSLNGATLDYSSYVGTDEGSNVLRYVDKAYSAGIVSVSSAGNAVTNSTDPTQSWIPPYDIFPADYGTVVSVMNLQNTSSSNPQSVELNTSSNYNATGERDKNISAPGTAIYSTIPTNSYGHKTGTSMASPNVAGVVGLIYAANQGLAASDVALREQGNATAAQATSILYGSARDIGATGWDETYGFGEVDAAAAVEAATAGVVEGPAFLPHNGSGTYTVNSRLDGWTFSSNDANVVSVGADGKATATAAGTTMVRASATDDTGVARTATLEINVVGPLVCNAPSIPVGGTTTLSVTQPSSFAWTWTSSNTGVATVSNGLVTGKSLGTTTITATLVADTSISFTQDIEVTSASVSVPTGASFVYDGAEHAGVATNAAYTLSGSTTQTNVGTYEVTATLVDASLTHWADNTTAPKTISWSITPVTLTATYPDATILINRTIPTDVTVTGFVNGETAASAADYTAPTVDTSGIDTTKEGTHTLTPAGGAATNYTFAYKAGTLTILEKYPIEVPVAKTGLVYNGSAQVGVVSTSEYCTLSGATATAAGSYTATATLTNTDEAKWADGQDGAERTISWSIAQASVSSAAVSGVSNKTYTGSAITQNPIVKVGGRTLAKGTDYTLSFSNNVNAGTARITITGKGNYTGSKVVTFRINAAGIGGATVSGIASQAYTGSALTPKPTVTLGSKRLTLNTDYTLSYASNVNPGTATVKVTGKGNYTGTVSRTFTIYAPATSVSYRTHVQSVGNQAWKTDGQVSGTSGRSLRLEGIWINLANKPASGSIQYRTHVQSIGWQDWKSEGAMSGTSGRSLRLEAIQIQLTGKMAELYDVYYRVHAQRFGWMGWAKNGAQAGTAHYSYRLEAIQVLVLPKGSSAPSTSLGGQAQATSAPFSDREDPDQTTPAVAYRTHVQNDGWQTWRRNGTMAGTRGRSLRLEGINVKLVGYPVSGGIQYRTHVQSIGWQGWRSDGAMSGTSGRSLRLEAIQIQLTGEMANKYDVFYRVHAQQYGWMGWAKNGASAGTAHHSYRLEGIQILVLPKGSATPSANYGGQRQATAASFRDR